MQFIKHFKRFFRSNNPPLKLRYSFGAGQPIVLIHGLGTEAATWEPLVQKLKGKPYRVIAFDLLGFGQSPKPTDVQYNVEDHAKALLDSLPKGFKKQPMILIGHSMGCLIASHIAATRPKLVKRLILYEPPLFADSPEFRSHTRRKNLYFALYQELLERPQLLFKYSKLMARLAANRAVAVDQASWLPFERSLKNTIMNQKAYDELKAIGVETDIIYGSFDFIVTRKDVKDMLEHNPNVQFHLVNASHDITARAASRIVKVLENPSVIL
jgi:cis-3-alkyl-4-acyloxetan-2-one decarboxylase